jgi:hypothetical protein
LASQLASSYNSALESQLTALASADGLNVHVVDAFGLVDDAVADPAYFGLTNVTSSVWTGSYTSAASGTLAATTPAEQDQYLFWDGLHPTEAGHQVIADAAEEQLTGTTVLAVANITTGQVTSEVGQPYTGPVAGPQQQYISVTPDNLFITAATPNWFISSDSVFGGITATSGSNVLATTGSEFMTGGSGNDIFYLDHRGATAASWSTITNFHAGDSATIWGLTPGDFTLSWLDGQGAAGYTGLTLAATGATAPSAALTLAGFTSAALSSGQLTVSSGTSGSSPYFTIHDNA